MVRIQNTPNLEYTLMIYTEGRFYIGIYLNWGYNNGHVDTEIPAYIWFYLYQFQHIMSSQSPYVPLPLIAKTYIRRNKNMKDRD